MCIVSNLILYITPLHLHIIRAVKHSIGFHNRFSHLRKALLRQGEGVRACFIKTRAANNVFTFLVLVKLGRQHKSQGLPFGHQSLPFRHHGLFTPSSFVVSHFYFSKYGNLLISLLPPLPPARLLGWLAGSEWWNF